MVSSPARSMPTTFWCWYFLHSSTTSGDQSVGQMPTRALSVVVGSLKDLRERSFQSTCLLSHPTYLTPNPRPVQDRGPSVLASNPDCHGLPAWSSAVCSTQCLSLPSSQGAPPATALRHGLALPRSCVLSTEGGAWAQGTTNGRCLICPHSSHGEAHPCSGEQTEAHTV